MEAGLGFVPGCQVYDPYLIGLWLGDGTSAGPSFTVADEEVVAYLRDVAVRERMLLIK